MSQSSKSALTSLLSAGFLVSPTLPVTSFTPPSSPSRASSLEPVTRPKTTRNSHSIGKIRENRVNIGEEMYRKGVESAQKRKEKAEMEFSTRYSFAPAISSRSKELAKGITRKPLYFTPEKTTKNSESPIKNTEKTEMEPEISRKTMNLTAFLARNYLKAQKKEPVRDLSAERRKEEELKECTFKPKIDKKSEKIAKKGEGLYARALKSREKRELEVKMEREARMSQELKECTFVPQLATAAGKAAPRKQVIIEPLPQLSESSQSEEEQS